MSYYIIKEGKKTTIDTELTEISSGGQGIIYKVKAPSLYDGYCVKIYKESTHIDEARRRIEYMVQNQPENIDMHNIRICWPQAPVFDMSGKFVGYLMKLAFPESRDLKILSIHSIGISIAKKHPKYSKWHNKFELTDSIGRTNRMKMLHNWALAVELIHKTNKYVVVDIKPDNVLATADGRISIVDTDSFQINDGINVYRGPVATPEYFPKFARQIEKQKKLQTLDCDYFALAVAFYKILIGSHPYSGFKLKPPYNTDDYADIASHIDADLFVFGNKQKYIELLPVNNMHARYESLPNELKILFHSAFTSNSNLPNANKWKEALKKALNITNVSQPRIKVKIDSFHNSESKCLCVLLVDVSGSMKLNISNLNNALAKFIADIKNGDNGFNEHSKESIELSVIQFDKDVNVLMKPTLIGHNTQIPKLAVRGFATNTFAAIETAFNVVEERKKIYKESGQSYYRPWIILLTDGNPYPMDNDKLASLSTRIADDLLMQKYIFTAIGIGTDIDKDILSKLSNGNYSVITKTGFSKFFQFLSASISAVERKDPQEDLLGEIEESFSVEL